ncbi:HAD family hydrolase [Histidinibacterium lentulum]|uniref:HAD family phosphatase n=1 Tax=Histidinibacterium lentulum TaxID=2480588 RepID=A0A3N2R955_9RHOB|nr:HAD family phosphatase [Histidinibacterium lentulum]ROU04009.1 HAD family phosphatase [Histidinibacterium lentulum]
MPALLFDLDGTMLETDPLHAAVFVELFAEHGREIDEAFYIGHLHGRQNADIFGEFFPAADASAMADLKEARFRERLGRSAEPMPGLLALLDRAEAEAWPVAVVSNAPTQNAHAMLAAIGLSDRIGTIVLGDDCPRGKPDPFPYAEAMRRLGVDPASAVAFEDSRAGLASASAAGAHAVGLTSSLAPEALRAAGARLVIRDFSDPALETALFNHP